MIKLLNKDLALIKYRNFPLLTYDEILEEDIFYCPEYIGCYWIKVKRENNTVLIDELLKLLNLFETEELIFLGQIDKPWISKPMSKRFGLAIYNKAIRFFKNNDIWTKFNGTVKVQREGFKEFLTHFFTLRKFEGYFWNHYFQTKVKTFFFLFIIQEKFKS